ncbi:hypothetical protein [Lysinibacillus xylanilyticus]|uniref:hypothetical protein n=1 Tax=Lysinibacillus xylanilyticus TaxID=582475 RepID=UPI00083C984F|nr:hypothetical protein [Lysinibacillus xylanilyticus]
MKLELYKELYQNELARKEVVHQRLQWTLSVWVILLGANLFCLNKVLSLDNYHWSALLFISLTSICLLVAILFFCIGLWGRKIRYLPKVNQINNHYLTLKNHYNGYVGYEQQADIEFDNYMIKKYIECTDSMIDVSDKKVYFTTLANISMIVCSFFLLLTFVLMTPDVVSKDEIQKVQIIERGELND